MSVAILHISGPPNAGKTALAVGLAEFRGKRPTYYLRLDTEREGAPALRLSQPLPVVVDPRRIVSKPGVVFETLSEAIGDIAQRDADATIIVETDNEPCFRHACPWHARVFCLPAISNPHVLFRSRDEIDQAVKALMEDTRSFAAEMFGLEKGPGDSSMLPAMESRQILESDALDLLEEFQLSEIGADITYRMKLHTEYYAIMDSDVLVLSESSGPWNGAAIKAAKMLNDYLETARSELNREVKLTRCNPADASSPMSRSCLAMIDQVIEAGRQDAI